MNDVYQRVVPPYENLRHVKVFNFSTRITFNFLYSNTHIRGLHVYHLAPKRRAADNDTIKSALLFDTYSSNVAGNAGTNFFALQRGGANYNLLLEMGFPLSKTIYPDNFAKRPFF